MNILKITHSYYPENNAGVELYVHELSNELSKKHNVMLFTVGKLIQKSVSSSNGDYRIFKIPKGTTKRNILKSLKQCIRTFNPDVVHIHHLAGLGLCIPILLRKLSIPYVITLHDYWFVCPRVRLINADGKICNFPSDDCAYCKYRENPLKRIFFRYRHRRQKDKILNVLDNAAYLLTPSKLIRDRLSDYGVHNKNFDISRLGINTQCFHNEGKKISKKDDIKIGFIGTISIFKGVEVLLRAIRLLKSGNKLYLYGKILKSDWLLIKEMIKADDRVVLKGEFDHKDITEVLKNIDILVVPSVCEESHNLAIDEGRAAGLPVIASAIGSIPDRIIDGINGFLVEPGDSAMLKDKLQWLIDNYTNVSSGMNFAYNLFTIEENAEYHENIYKTAIKQ